MSKIKKDTGKFWSFKDTDTKKSNSIYEYKFKKSYLIKVVSKDIIYYTIPIRYFCFVENFKDGFYIGLSDSENNIFKDHQIK